MVSVPASSRAHVRSLPQVPLFAVSANADTGSSEKIRHSTKRPLKTCFFMNILSLCLFEN